MASWTSEQLSQIAGSDKLQIATPKRDATMRRPVPIWVVRHGDALYVRSYRGEAGGWYRGAKSHGRGHISAHGIDAVVTLTHIIDQDINTEIDAAFRDKYARYGPRFVEPMTAPTARATTLKLIPADQRKGT